MHHLFLYTFFLTLFISACYAAAIDKNETNKESKSVFGQAFDEIVVESHLTVRRKNNERQGRTQNVTNESPGVTKTKREIKLPTDNQVFFAPLDNFDALDTWSQIEDFGPR